MNEQWKRLIEAERRLLRLESTLHRTNNAITGVQSALQNDSRNVVNPFGAGGGGTLGIHRFPVEFEAWVEWTTAPTLKTGASLNVPADGPALAAAYAKLVEGITLNADNSNTNTWSFGYERNRSLMVQFCVYDFRDSWIYSGGTYDYDCFFKVAIYDDGQYLADAEEYFSGAYLNINDVFLQAENTASQSFRLEIEWPRRNGFGAVFDTQTLVARRTLASEDTFSIGPKYGTSGTWSFAMECPATTYHNAGSGTIYLRWGTAVETIVAGGTSGSLPSDSYDGGSADSLPTDIIDGGTF